MKPDGVERRLIGEILGRLERRGLRLVAGDLRPIDEATAERHYAEHAEKPFFGELVAFITRSPAFVCVVEGPEDTWAIVRVDRWGPPTRPTPPPGRSGATSRPS